MKPELKLTSGQVLDRQFDKNMKGYDPNQVDDFLDLVLLDYKEYERFSSEVTPYVEQLELAIKDLRQKIAKLELDNAKMKERLKNIKSTDNNVSTDNISYIKRINVLETALWSLGKDPSKIK